MSLDWDASDRYAIALLTGKTVKEVEDAVDEVCGYDNPLYSLGLFDKPTLRALREEIKAEPVDARHAVWIHSLKENYEDDCLSTNSAIDLREKYGIPKNVWEPKKKPSRMRF